MTGNINFYSWHWLTSNLANDKATARLRRINYFKNVSVINIDSITNNLLKHRLVPEHIPIRDKKSITEILDKCNVNINQLPIILKEDIMSKLTRLSPGDICKIKRKNLKSGENNFYRVCK